MHSPMLYPWYHWLEFYHWAIYNFGPLWGHVLYWWVTTLSSPLVLATSSFSLCYVFFYGTVCENILFSVSGHLAELCAISILLSSLTCTVSKLCKEAFLKFQKPGRGDSTVPSRETVCIESLSSHLCYWYPIHTAFPMLLTLLSWNICFTVALLWQGLEILIITIEHLPLLSSLPPSPFLFFSLPLLSRAVHVVFQSGTHNAQTSLPFLICLLNIDLETKTILHDSPPRGTLHTRFLE